MVPPLPPIQVLAADPASKILDQHISIVTLLESHAALLVDSMPQHSTGEGSAQRLLETRLQKTEALISFFKESAAALVGHLQLSGSVCH